MDTNKMREEFEAAFVDKYGFGHLTASANSDAHAMYEAAKWGWEASREAVVVDLPEGLTLDQLKSDTAQADPEHERWLTRPGIVRAIEAQGLKVAP